MRLALRVPRAELARRPVLGGLAVGQRTFLVALLAGELCGAIWGLIRGLDHLSTAWAAPIEGALLALPLALGLASVALCGQWAWHFGRSR